MVSVNVSGKISGFRSFVFEFQTSNSLSNFCLTTHVPWILLCCLSCKTPEKCRQERELLSTTPQWRQEWTPWSNTPRCHIGFESISRRWTRTIVSAETKEKTFRSAAKTTVPIQWLVEKEFGTAMFQTTASWRRGIYINGELQLSVLFTTYESPLVAQPDFSFSPCPLEHGWLDTEKSPSLLSDCIQMCQRLCIPNLIFHIQNEISENGMGLQLLTERTLQPNNMMLTTLSNNSPIS